MRRAPADPARLFDLGVAGDLRLDLDTKAALALLVAELGPDPTGERLAALDATLRSGLPREAADQALALMQAWRRYAHEADAATAARTPPDHLDAWARLLDDEAALRRRHFDAATAQALFGAQETWARYTLAARRIAGDPPLGETDRAAGLVALRAALPEEVAAPDPGVAPTAVPASAAGDASGERGVQAASGPDPALSAR